MLTRTPQTHQRMLLPQGELGDEAEFGSPTIPHYGTAERQVGKSH
jgi:hypothetical protein